MASAEKEGRQDIPIRPELWVTPTDLLRFKSELLQEIEVLLSRNQPQEVKKWLKSYEVRKLLNISPGTLQTLRLNGTLPFTKMGGALYYEYKEIQKILDDAKSKPKWMPK